MILFNNSVVKFSHKDRKKGIKIPTKLTPKLAEDIGIHIGDGSLYLTGRNKKSPEFSCSCHVEEKDYFEEFVIPLKNKLFNLNKFKREQRGNEYKIRFYSLAVCTFYSRVFGLPIGKKSRIIDIPKLIINSHDKTILKSCIRGIVDTDFSLRFVKKKDTYSYPILTGGFASKMLVLSLENLFRQFNITSCVYKDNRRDKRTNKIYPKSVIQISGKKNLGKFVNEIGFHNPKHLRKLRIWLKTGERKPSK